MNRSWLIGVFSIVIFIFSVSLGYGLEIKRTESYNSKGYNLPDIGGATLKSEEMIDLTDKIEGKETMIRIYETKDGSLFRVYSIKGKVFRYDIDIDKKFPYEYALLDKDGDGIFETRQDLTGDVVMEGQKERFYIDIDRTTPYEYIHVIEKEEGSYEWRQRLKGEIVFIPLWVVFKF